MRCVKKIGINALSGPDRDWLVEEIERRTGYRVVGDVIIAAIVDDERPVRHMRYQMPLPIKTPAYA